MLFSFYLLLLTLGGAVADSCCEGAGEAQVRRIEFSFGKIDALPAGNDRDAMQHRAPVESR